MQEMSDLCRLDPVDDALNIITVRVQGREVDVVQSSVMLLQTKNVKEKISTMKRKKINTFSDSEHVLPAARPASRSAESGGSEDLDCRDSEG